MMRGRAACAKGQQHYSGFWRPTAGCFCGRSSFEFFLPPGVFWSQLACRACKDLSVVNKV
eukprot:2523335-Amphidinium_carterae.2